MQNIDAAYSYACLDIAQFVYRCVCVLVMTENCLKTAEPVETVFVLLTRVCPRNRRHVLDQFSLDAHTVDQHSSCLATDVAWSH